MGFGISARSAQVALILLAAIATLTTPAFSADFALTDGSAAKGEFLGIAGGELVLQGEDGKQSTVPFDKLHADVKARVMRLDAAQDEPAVTPPWLKGYKARFTLRLVGDMRSDKNTVLAKIPTGGWIRPDASDLAIVNGAGQRIPAVVLSNDTHGETLVQFRKMGPDRWYFAYAHNPDAPPKDMTFENKIKALKEEAQQAVLKKMAAMKQSAARAAELRDLKAAIDRHQTTSDAAAKELAAWDKQLPGRKKAAEEAAAAVPPQAKVVTEAQAAHKPFADEAEAKTKVAQQATREAASARAKANEAKSAHDKAVKAMEAAKAALSKAQEDLATAKAAAPEAASVVSDHQSQQAAAQKEFDQAATTLKQAQAQLDKARANTDEDGKVRDPQAVAQAEAAVRNAKRSHDQAQAKLEVANKRLQLAQQKKAEADKALASAQQAVPAAQQKVEQSTAAIPPLKQTMDATETEAKAKEDVAAKANEAAKQARLAAAPTETTLKEAQAKLAELNKKKGQTATALKEAQDRIASAKAIKKKADEELEKLTPRYEPAKKAAADAAAEAESWRVKASELDQELFDTAATADPRLYKEGLSVEFREWAGDNLSGWREVVDGLQASDNILGSAIVDQVLQNVNPYRRDDPRNFAASYRGYLKVDKPGVYSFFVNGDDTAFLFINGYRVYSRTGTNKPITGKVPLYSVGADMQLEAGLHPFEIHHIVGNTPNATGLATLLWIPPGEGRWQFVPEANFNQSLVATTTSVTSHDGKPVAIFDWGMDDTLSADGLTLYLGKFQAIGNLSEGDGSKLKWTFGDDGVTASGTQRKHVFFTGGDHIVRLKSHPDLPAFQRRCNMWEPPTPTSPHSLADAVAVLDDIDVTELSQPVLNDAFHFLRICQQPSRWPVMEKVCQHLVDQKDIDLKYKALAYQWLMTSLAEQGRGDEALKRLDAALDAVGHIRTLKAAMLTHTADVYRDYLRDYQEASDLYQQVIGANQRLRHPVVRQAAVGWGDMFLDTGQIAEAGEAYRLANDLGTLGGLPASDDPVKRGALLRVAEQQLKGGDIRQTTRVLERIEAEFPEQKLEGLYRFLRGEALRNAGRYEQAIRDYEALLKLRQWAGYRANAIYGIVDSYYRMGNYQQAMEWLPLLEESFPQFLAQRDQADYKQVVENRMERAQRMASDGEELGEHFSSYSTGFEPEEDRPGGMTPGYDVRKSLGIHGPHTAVLATSEPQRPEAVICDLQNLPPQGSLWVELWYRDRSTQAGRGDQRHLTLEVRNDKGEHVEHQTVWPSRTFGTWQKMGFSLKLPKSVSGRVLMRVHLNRGFIEVDGVSVRHTSDAQETALRDFIEGADPQ